MQVYVIVSKSCSSTFNLIFCIVAHLYVTDILKNLFTFLISSLLIYSVYIYLYIFHYFITTITVIIISRSKSFVPNKVRYLLRPMLSRQQSFHLVHLVEALSCILVRKILPKRTPFSYFSISLLTRYPNCHSMALLSQNTQLDQFLHFLLYGCVRISAGFPTSIDCINCFCCMQENRKDKQSSLSPSPWNLFVACEIRFLVILVTAAQRFGIRISVDEPPLASIVEPLNIHIKELPFSVVEAGRYLFEL